MDDYTFKRSIADSFACIAQAVDHIARQMSCSAETGDTLLSAAMSRRFEIENLIKAIREPAPSGHPLSTAAWDMRRIDAALKLADLISPEEKK